MGQGFSNPLPAGSSATEAAEFADCTFEKPLGGGRFLRTTRARHQHGIVVAKVCLKSSPSVSFKKYATALRQERQALLGVANVLPYQRVRETSTLGLLVRQYVHTSLYDRISIRPFLETIEKKWIAFQLLCAVRDCHARSVFHGDIKSENVLVTSWGWIYLTDFASVFKPVYLPEDNPADFSFFFDTSARRTCYVAPERFLAAGEKPTEGNVVQWNMDIFSLGCVIAELFTETPTFTLTQLFKYRKGEYDPTVTFLNKIDDLHVRALISSMIRLSPEDRWHAQDYLDEYKGKAFPLYFYQHLHPLMQDITDPTSGRRSVAPSETNNGGSDDRITRIYDDFEMLSVSLGYGSLEERKTVPSSRVGSTEFPLQIDLPNSRHAASASTAGTGDNGTFILLNVITASLRSTARSASKIQACELLLAFAERLPDEAKLDRILPYVMPLLEDSNQMVIVTALRTMAQLMALVTVASPVNAFLFTQYVFPHLQILVKTNGFKDNAIVRATYAACLASLADTAARILDMMQALRADGSLPTSTKGVNDEADENAVYQDAYDATRAEVLDGFEAQTKVFLTDKDTAVRRAFLSSVPGLCVVFGEARASDVILSHLNTYLNDSDWQLKCAFLRTIVGVAVYIGGPSLEDFILPLILQALTDPQEFVMEQALRSLASMAEIGLLQRPKTWELIDTVARFELHPNTWVKEAAAHFVSAATTYMSIVDVRILVAPLVTPYLKVPTSSLLEDDLLDSLKQSLPRNILDLCVDWAKRADHGQFWKTAKESRQLSYRATNGMPPVSSVAQIGPRSLSRLARTDEDEQWLGRLRNAGLRTEDESKIIALREYLWRTAQRRKKDEHVTRETIYEETVPLSRLDVTLQTVIFDDNVEVYEERLKDQGLSEKTIADAIEEATGTTGVLPCQRLRISGVTEEHQTPSPGILSKVVDNEQRRLPGSRKQGSANLSSSPSSRAGLQRSDSDRSMLHKTNPVNLMAGKVIKNKAVAEVATDDTRATAKLSTPLVGSRRASPSPGSTQRPQAMARAASHRAVHNYAGNDPTVLKLLDAVYVDKFPIDAAEFGPLIQPTRRGPLSSGSVQIGKSPWCPQGLLVAVLGEHTDMVTRILVSPDHTFVLTASDDGTVKVWDSARLERNVTHRSRQTFKLEDQARVTSLCFVEATHAFICTGSNGSVLVVKVDVSESATTTRYGKLRTLKEWHIAAAVAGGEWAVWSEHFRGESASTLMLATNLGRIIAVDLRSMSIVFEVQNPARHGIPTCFCVGRRHDWLLVGTIQGVLDLWDLRFRVRLRSWAFPAAAPITRLQLHPSRKTARRNRVCISGGSARGEVTVWDIEKIICHEVYRPPHPQTSDRLHLRDYELRALDDDRAEVHIDQVSGALAASPITIESAAGASATTALHFGVHHAYDDSESVHAFAITGGPDGKVRFWDSDRLSSCCVVNGGGSEPSTTYTISQLGLDTRVITEKVVDASLQSENGTATTSSSAGRKALGTLTGRTPRYESMRQSARGLLNDHLDVISDVAVLERPFGMVLSADRSGQVFVYQ